MRYIIDVRTKEEFDAGHVDCATNITLADMINGELGCIASLPKDTIVECYCASGVRSERAKHILESHGFTRVTNLGGIGSF